MFQEDIKIVDKNKTVCHSGGAIGSDLYWEECCKLYNIPTKHYSYKTKYHNSHNKIEISEEDFNEGIEKIKIANKTLNRYGINKYLNLLARNWVQVKESSIIIAIGEVVKANTKSKKGYLSKSKFTTVGGGTGWAVQMGIDKGVNVFVFDQYKCKWFNYSYSIEDFIEYNETPIITNENFAGIGTREINEKGEQAIKDVLRKTFIQ